MFHPSEPPVPPTSDQVVYRITHHTRHQAKEPYGAPCSTQVLQYPYGGIRAKMNAVAIQEHEAVHVRCNGAGQHLGGGSALQWREAQCRTTVHPQKPLHAPVAEAAMAIVEHHGEGR